MEHKLDCFAIKKKKNGQVECKALRVLDCENCSFYKTREQNKKEDSLRR